MIVVDTSIIIDFLRQKNKQQTIFYTQVARGEKLAVSIITQTELYAGKSVWQTPFAQQELTNIFSVIKVIPSTQEISVLAGKIRAQSHLDLIDAIIAATTVINDSRLLTLNRKDFLGVPDLQFVDYKL